MIQIFSPLNGEIKRLEKVNDDVFSQKMLGDGVAIVPKDGNLYAPMDAEISMVFPTGHAIGLKSPVGIELLIHIGIDTVEMEGKGFETFVKQGQQVKKGDLLIRFSPNEITNAGFDNDTMIIITNRSDTDKLFIVNENSISVGDLLLEL